MLRNNCTISITDLSTGVSSFVPVTAAGADGSISWDGKVTGNSYKIQVPGGQRIILQVRG